MHDLLWCMAQGQPVRCRKMVNIMTNCEAPGGPPAARQTLGPAPPITRCRDVHVCCCMPQPRCRGPSSCAVSRRAGGGGAECRERAKARILEAAEARTQVRLIPMLPSGREKAFLQSLFWADALAGQSKLIDDDAHVQPTFQQVARPLAPVPPLQLCDGRHGAVTWLFTGAPVSP